MNVYLEVSVHERGFEIYDHTHYVQVLETEGKPRDVADMRARYKFQSVIGKQVSYHIMGLKSFEQCKQFAIWYHVNKASGNIRTYRLD